MKINTKNIVFLEKSKVLKKCKTKIRGFTNISKRDISFYRLTNNTHFPFKEWDSKFKLYHKYNLQSIVKYFVHFLNIKN